MKICCVRCGYVGIVAGTCLADMGNDVICSSRKCSLTKQECFYIL